MNRIKIYNGFILTPFLNMGLGTVIIEDNKIVGVERGNIEVPDAEEIDAAGCYISPGFIDLHTHGAGGSDFMDGTVEACLQIAHTHALHGTTLLYPTTLSATNEELFDFFEVYAQAKKQNWNGASFGGLHLEGPYFAYNQRGAQDPRFLRNPEPKEYMEILDRCANISRWSLAPELPSAHAFAHELLRRGITPSIAHTDAIYEDILEAYKAGFHHITHFYSCMNGITRRNAYRYAGCIEAGYLIDGMTLEIIADNVHVPKPLMQLVAKIKGPENIALVTDSMRAAGMPEGRSLLGSLHHGMEVIVEDGVAKLPDLTAFAGSVATADRLVRTMTSVAEQPLTAAVQMMTSTPARMAGLEHCKGRIAVGYDADIVLFNKDIRVTRTLVGGKQIINQKTN